MSKKQRANFEYLLGGLLILILVSALVHEYEFMDETQFLFMEPAVCLMLLLGIWGLGERKTWLITGALIVATGFATALVAVWGNNPELRLVNLGIVLGFCLSSTWLALQNLLRSNDIDLNKIFGGICAYLLIGLIWAFFYLFINLVSPESFNGLTSTMIVHQFPDLLYFSFVTLATVGYGDLTPVKPLARTVAYLEAIVGQFYVAVLVAWLVSMYISGKAQKNKYP